MKIKLKKQLKCKRCGHEWNPRTEEVFSCPKCHSPKWNIENQEVIKNEYTKKGLENKKT